MNTLKRIAADKLVIFVSHNARIIEEYSDYLIELSDGKIVYSSSFPRTLVDKLHRKKRGPFSWVSHLLQKNFMRDISKNILAFISGAIGFCAILLSFGFFSGSQGIMEEEAKRSLLYTQGSLSETVTYEIEGSPLSLTQSGRPLLNEAKDILGNIDYEIKNDYSYFFPSYSSYSFDGEKQQSVYFSPLCDMSLADREVRFSYIGELPKKESFSYCFVNQEFSSLFDESLLGKTIDVSKKVEIEMDETIESVLVKASFKIVAIVEEFSFLNSPRVYYSYDGLESYLKTLQFPILSLQSGLEITAYSLVNEAEGDSPYSNFSYLLFAKNETEANKINFLSKSWPENTYSFYSEAITIGESFSSLTSAFSQSLIPFLVLAIGSFSFILGVIALSSFIEKKKEAAILLALGARKRDVTSLYEYEAICSSLLAAILALAISYPCTWAFNLHLKNATGISNLINIPYSSYFGIPFFPIISIVLFAIMLGYFSSAIPLFFATKAPLSEELRDE